MTAIQQCDLYSTYKPILGLTMKGFYISTEQTKFNFDLIYQFISTSYWAKNIPVTTMQAAIKNAFCFGIFDDCNTQVGFARVITDKATFAYLADVFVIESQRGKGLSKWLIDTIVNHEELQGLRRIMLATKDAHGLYAQYGFKPIDNDQSIMQIWQPDVYLQ